MVNTPTFGVRLTADGAAFVGPVKLSKQSVDDLDRSVRNTAGGTDLLAGSLSKIRTQVLALVTLGSVLAAAFQFAKNADEVNLLDARLRIVTKSTQDFVQAQTGLQQIAARLQVSYSEVVGSFTRVSRGLQQYGADTQFALRVTELFAATVKISGASTSEAASSMQQFGQALGSGVLAGDELKALLENNSRFSQALAESLGVNVGQLKKMGEEGKLSVDKIVNALTSQAGKIESEMAKIPRTISGAVTEGANQLSRYASELDKSVGFSQAFVDVAGDVAAAIKEMAEEQKLFNDMAGNGTGEVNELIKPFRALALAVAVVIDVINFAVDVVKLIGSTFKAVAFQVIGFSNIIVAAFEWVAAAHPFAEQGAAEAAAERYANAIRNMGATLKETAEDTKKVLFGPVEGTLFDRLSRQFERGDAASAPKPYTGKTGVDGPGPDPKDADKAPKAAYELAQKQRDLAKSTADAIYNIQKDAADRELELLEKTADDSIGALSAYYQRKKELLVADIAEQREGLLDQIGAQEEVLRKARATKDKKDEIEALAKLIELRAKLTENQNRGSEVTLLEIEAGEKKGKLTRSLLGDAQKELDNAKERAAAFGKTKVAILEEAIAREKARLVAISFGDVNDDEIAVLRERIKLLEQARDLESDTDRREGAAKWFKDQADAAKKSAEQISESLTDALFRAFEAGDSFGKAFFKNLVNMAKTTVLKPTIEFLMSPIKNALGNFFSNMIPGMPGMPGGGGGGFNFMSLFGMGGGGGPPADLMGGGTFDNTGWAGTGLSGSTGAPTFMSQAAPFLTAALVGAGIGRAVGRNRNNRSTAGGAAGATIGMALGGPIGAAIGAILGGLAADRGGAKQGGSSFQQFGANGNLIGDYRIPTSDNGRFYTPSGEDGKLRELTSTMASGFFKQLTELGGKVNGAAFGLGFDKDPKGSADNRISGQTIINGRIVRTVQDRGVGTSEEDLQKELGIEIQRFILAGMQAADFGENGKAISDLLKSVNTDTATEEDINKIYETAMVFKKIIDSVGATMKGFTDKLIAFKDAAPETLAALGTIFEYVGADPFALFKEQSQTLADTWRSQGDAMRDLLADFDGSEASIRRLGEMSAQRYQTEIQLAAAVMGALQSVADTTANSIRNIRLSVLDDEGKYGFLDKEAAGLFEQLGLANDPATINALVEQLNAIINQAFGLLSPEEQAARAEEFITRLNDVSALAGDKLKGIKDEITGDKATDLPSSIRTAIEDAMNKAADRMMGAAQANQNAADTLNAGANTFAGAVANATGTPVGGGGNQVTTFDGDRP